MADASLGALLAAALREGRLAGAALDVFQEEPLPAEFIADYRRSAFL